MPHHQFQHVRFLPWIGDNYKNGGGVFRQRTLILGGSHYSDEYESFQNPELRQEWATFTNEVVEYYLDDNIRGKWKGTYSRFVNSVYGDTTDLDRRRNFFESVVFYNYLQDVAGGGPTEAHRYDYNEPRHFQAFTEVIETLRPEVVISWGYKAWNALPNDWGFGPAVVSKGIELEAGGKSFDIYDYPYRGTDIRLVGVHHPSIGYDVGFHHALFKHLNLLA